MTTPPAPGPLIDLMTAGITIGLGVVVIWRGLLAHRLTELWWCCVAVTVVAAVSVRANAAALDGLTGVGLSVLLTNLATLAAATLAVQCVLAHRGRHPRRSRLGTSAAALTAAALLVTWLAAVPTELPPGLAESSAAEHGTAMVAHWLTVHGYLLVILPIFGWLAVRDLRELPAGRARASLMLLVITAAGLLLWAASGVALHMVGSADQTLPFTTPATRSAVLTLALGLFLVAVVLPLRRADHGQPSELDTAAVHAGLWSLWSWITTSPYDLDAAATELDDEAALDLVIEIRDQVHDMQRWIRPAEYAAAVAAGRTRDGSVPSTKAWITAVCLELARAAQLRGDPPARAGVDLSALGGGDSLPDEALWLAEVAYARVDRAAEAAAHIGAGGQARQGRARAGSESRS